MHSSIQVCMLQVGPAIPLSQMQFWSLSQWPWKLHFAEQSLDTLQKKGANKHKKLLPTKKIGRGWVAKHSKCWACNRSPNPAQNLSWVCFSLALTSNPHRSTSDYNFTCVLLLHCIFKFHFITIIIIIIIIIIYFILSNFSHKEVMQENLI